MPASWLCYQFTGQYSLDFHPASQCTPMFDTEALDRPLGRQPAPVARRLSAQIVPDVNGLLQVIPFPRQRRRAPPDP